MKGFVYLAGAGPGDPGLISRNTLDALAKSDCIIYDYLASAELLRELDCEKIYVGKQGGDHTLPQDDINELIVKKAGEGKTVTRLKGGDPFIFGRGGEEAEILRDRGIDFAIVPGISSFYSAPAYAGIPLTHRDYANAFEVITGHRKEDALDEDINFPDYDDHKTFVFLMGMKNLRHIASSLIKIKNFPADTPAAVVSWGTTTRQRTASGTLSNIADIAESEKIGAPAIIVIGKVVLLRDKLRWFDNLPLFGKRIVVTRTRKQASALSKKLSALGADVIEFPTIEIKPINHNALNSAISSLNKYAWIIFTSQNAVNIFFDAMKKSGLDARALAGLQIAAIGPATAGELEKYFIKSDIVPKEYIAEAIIDELKSKDISGKHILVPCASEARDALKSGLEALGAIVNRLHTYDTVIPSDISEETKSHIKNADIITFTSSSTAKNFFKIAGDTNAILACIGPVTADAVKALGHTPHISAKEYTIDGLVNAITEYYG